MDKNIKTYEVWTKCRNCGFLGSVHIEYGIKVDVYLKELGIICSHCGCADLMGAGTRWIYNAENAPNA